MSDSPASDTGSEKKPEGSKKSPSPPPRATLAQWVFLAVVAITSAALDLGTKAWAMKRLSVESTFKTKVCVPPPGQKEYVFQNTRKGDITVSENYLHFRYAENCGGAWGFLHSQKEWLRKPFFVLVTAFALTFIVYLYNTLEKNQKAMRWALPLVLGGAIGNLVDRIRLGFVVDFIDAHWKESYHWPTFNVADIAISVGIGLMLLEYIIGPKSTPAKPTTKTKAKPKTSESTAA